MKCIDELKKIGIDKVSAKTRITQDKLQDIINFKYESFNKTHARGFIQIIEREFNVDLSEWFDAFNEFHAVAPQVEESDEVSEEINKNINIPIESTKKDKSYIVLITIFVILLLSFMGFFVYNNFIKQEYVSPTITQDLPQEPTNESANIENNADSTQNIDSTQNADSTQKFEEIPIDEASNAIDNNINNEPNNTIEIANTANDEITITPNEPLWVGIIDLKTHKKQQFSISSKHSFSLDNDKIIRTGHSYFSIEAPNFHRQFLGGNNKYLLYKIDSGIKEISHDEFLSLNGGVEW